AGSDGSIGLRHIKECGGLTITQDPGEAEFDSMPRNAIATGMVDLVLPVRQMSHEIVQFCRTQPQLPTPDVDDAIDAQGDDLLGQILRELRRRTGHDFGVYKRVILLRRLRRRMQLRHVMSFAAYLQVISREPDEADAFANDLLTIPTEFFWDTPAVLDLEQQIIPDIFARKKNDRERVRVWSIGCSTGEEAYSLAILLLEERARNGGHLQLQVFASDASEK